MDDMYLGFVDLEGTLYDAIVTRNGSLVPSAITGSVSISVYNATLSGTLLTTTTSSTLTTGVYYYSIAVTAANGFAAGGNYLIVASYTISSTTYTVIHTFTVV